MRNDKRKYRIKEQTKIYILIMKHRSKTTNVIAEVEEPNKKIKGARRPLIFGAQVNMLRKAKEHKRK